MAEKVVLVLDLEKGDFDTPFGELIKQAESSADKAGKKASSKFNKSFKFEGGALGANLAKIGVAAAAAGAALAGIVTAKSISLANQQEDAIKRLNTSLQVNGDFSEAASQDLQNFASELQKTTRFGDEAILNQLALAKSFGATNDQAKEIAKAATDLSEALGIDLESATRNVAKTLGGYAGELAETIPALKELTKEQLQAGEGVKLLAQQFGGTAQAQVKTFSGGLAQLSNSAGDFLEEIGFIITKSPAIKKTIEVINKSVNSLTKSFKDFRKDFNLTTDVILPLLDVADTINTYVVPAFELMFNVGRIVFNGLKAAFFGVISGITEGLGFLGEVIEKYTGNTFLSDWAKESQASIDKSFNDASANAQASLDSIFEGSFTEQTAQRIEEIRQFYIDAEAAALVAKNKIDQSNQDSIDKSAEKFVTYGTFLDAFSEQFSMTVEKTEDDFKKAEKAVNSFAVKTANALKNGVGVAAGNAFAKFGSALVTGENALASFGKAFLQSIGQVLVQQGTAFILEGTAYAFSANPQLQALSGGLIAAGAAMATFGGIIGAVTSGGASSVGGGGVGSNAPVQTSTFSADTETTSPDEVERVEEQTNVQLVIQGDVLDSDETGTRIASILSSAFEKDGIVLNEGATA
jgi:uncharacterized membrane protein